MRTSPWEGESLSWARSYFPSSGPCDWAENTFSCSLAGTVLSGSDGGTGIFTKGTPRDGQLRRQSTPLCLPKEPQPLRFSQEGYGRAFPVRPSTPTPGNQKQKSELDSATGPPLRLLTPSGSGMGREPILPAEALAALYPGVPFAHHT